MHSCIFFSDIILQYFSSFVNTNILINYLIISLFIFAIYFIRKFIFILCFAVSFSVFFSLHFCVKKTSGRISFSNSFFVSGFLHLFHTISTIQNTLLRFKNVITANPACKIHVSSAVDCDILKLPLLNISFRIASNVFSIKKGKNYPCPISAFASLPMSFLLRREAMRQHS